MKLKIELEHIGDKGRVYTEWLEIAEDVAASMTKDDWWGYLNQVKGRLKQSIFIDSIRRETGASTSLILEAIHANKGMSDRKNIIGYISAHGPKF